MNRSEKEERVLKEDGKVFEIRDLVIEATHLNPKYMLVKQATSILRPTGLLKIFELQPISGTSPSFTARWDGGSCDEGKEQRDDLDVDIEGVSNSKRLRFEHGENGYNGHHSRKLQTPDGRTYEVSIRTPGEIILEATVSFSAHRRLTLSDAISFSDEVKVEGVRVNDQKH